ncbi:hypothetical protein JJB07_05995 [Tumebacillus sp. ITR2]|uniref:Uncharacterized protein n=1 Tax=Tumebacillus amylolyticus TaxID=2801339 RepID=A0ABS1J7E0_9BACL|nr:hypothetical protein [Tumebacillus amylolyticus]MBL0386202.1 hypothetical protein [Tumebacillus amylolyticus]
MRRYFVGRAHPDVQDDLRRSMEEVGQRIVELGSDEFEAAMACQYDPK